MKKLNFFLFTLFIIAVLCLSCHKQYHLYIQFDDASGLAANVPITKNGVAIGKIENLALENKKVIVTALFPKKCQIPIGSDFELNLVDLFGGKGISVTYDTLSKEYHHKGDTIAGITKPYTISGVNGDAMRMRLDSLKLAIDSVSDIFRKLNPVLPDSSKKS